LRAAAAAQNAPKSPVSRCAGTPHESWPDPSLAEKSRLSLPAASAGKKTHNDDKHKPEALSVFPRPSQSRDSAWRCISKALRSHTVQGRETRCYIRKPSIVVCIYFPFTKTQNYLNFPTKTSGLTVRKIATTPPLRLLPSRRNLSLARALACSRAWVRIIYSPLVSSDTSPFFKAFANFWLRTK
jgi:hypothetical protein